MATTDSNWELEAVARWFKDRCSGMHFSPDRDEDEIRFFWVDLTRLSSGEVVAPMFGRGATELAAAQRAQNRYEVEQ